MTDNLPALPQLRTSQELVNPVTDSWAEMLPQVAELARAISNTDFVPAALRNNVAATTAAILYNREIGLPPLTGLNAVHVIKGKVGISAEMMRAQVLAAGHEIWCEETNTSYCVMAGRRSGSDRVTTVKYSESDAKTAGLFSNDNYKKNPRRMYQARATSELCALQFPDVIRGMSSSEELYDEAEAGEGIAVPAEGGTTVQRKVSRPRRASPAALEAAAEVPLPGETQTDDGAALPVRRDGEPGLAAAPSSQVPLPGESEPPQTDDGAGAPPATGGGLAGEANSTPVPSSLPVPGEQDLPPEVEHESEPRMISRAQQRAMFAVFNDLNIEDKADRLRTTERFIGRVPIDHQTGEPSSNGMTAAEAKVLLDSLAKCKTRDHVEALLDMVEQQRAAAEQDT